MKNNTSSPLVPALCVGAVLAVGSIWSYFNRTPAVPVTFIAGLDTSRSVRVKLPGGGTQLGGSRGALARLGTALNPATDRLALVRVDRESYPFYSQEPPSGTEKLLELLIQQTQRPATQDGTFPAKFWTLAARTAAAQHLSPGKAVVVGYWGDGDNDDMTVASRQQIEAAARQLAGNPRVVGVGLYGLKKENWEEMERLFAPLGSRLHLAPIEKLGPDKLLEKLDEARRKAAPA